MIDLVGYNHVRSRVMSSNERTLLTLSWQDTYGSRKELPSARWYAHLSRRCRSGSVPRRCILVSIRVQHPPPSPHPRAHSYASLSIWYPRHMLQYRIGIFYGGASIAGAFSGLLAFGISFMSGRGGLLGWSWIFVSLVFVLISLDRTNAHDVSTRLLKDS